ncbi:TetR/AcrR family transcriptional regulator [Streptacidiphilus sp. 4-A2]|nr:TetR/AcrR family transcriptional regulator [Streptacidiphilus sp. 4-A2]
MAQQDRGKRTRERVLDAAAEEFAVQGYSRTTINAVAARLGMSKGALYGHFPRSRCWPGLWCAIPGAPGASWWPTPGCPGWPRRPRWSPWCWS